MAFTKTSIHNFFQALRRVYRDGASGPYLEGVVIVDENGDQAGIPASPLDTDITDRIGRLVGRMSNYDVLSNGTLGALNETVEMAGEGLSTIGLGISGTWVGTIVAETTAGDGIWDPIPMVDNSLGSAALSTTVNGNFLLGIAGSLTIRVRMSIYASGTATVYLEGSSAASGAFLTRSIPTGINSIGSVVLDAAENHIGEVGGNSVVSEVTLSLDTVQYASGEVLAATQIITACMRVNGGTGVIHSVVLLDKDDQAGALDLVFLRTNVGIGTENAAVSVADADADEILGIIEIAAADYVDLVNSQLVTKSNVGIVVDADAAADDLYVAAISRDTKTYTASGITLKIGFLRD